MKTTWKNPLVIPKRSASLWRVCYRAAAAGWLVLVGCSSDLPVASRLERARVLGARVDAATDPGRAAVLPGEAAVVTWLVAAPTDPGVLDWTFSLCTGLDGACVDAPSMISGSSTGVAVPFTTPDASVLTGGRAPLMAGLICANGTLATDPDSMMPVCLGDAASGNAARFVIPVAEGATAPNRHPNLGNDVIELGGVIWTAPAVGDSGVPCDASSGLPIVAATAAGASAAKQQIRLVSDGDDRETVVVAGSTATTLEELQISNFATAGTFDSSYAAIFASDTRPDADAVLPWTPPGANEVPSSGLVVQFHFVVRDGRGGIDWTHRSLCVVTP